MKKVLTLLVIHKGNKVLLGMKKRGFGMGNWNGFGGKVQDGETIEVAAKRELLEESGLRVDVIEELGVLNFSWQDKPDVLEVHIFKALDFIGNLVESEEMRPQWFSVSEIPFEKMWQDDKYWFPLFLQNKKFRGTILFDDHNNIVKYELHESHSN